MQAHVACGALSTRLASCAARPGPAGLDADVQAACLTLYTSQRPFASPSAALGRPAIETSQELLEILPQLLKVEAVDDVRALLGPQNVANYHMQQQQAAAHAGAPQGQCCGGSAAAAAVAAAAAAAAANAAAAAAAAAVDGCEGSGSGSASVYCGGAGGGASASAAVNVRLGLPPPPMAAAPAPTPLGVRG